MGQAIIPSVPDSIGYIYLSRQRLEAYRSLGQVLSMKVIGILAIDDSTPPDLVAETLSSLTVYGAIIASPTIHAALAHHVKLIGLTLE
ncbi:MAG: hypothetical protein DPW16_21270 [Chloroflexi bacterium]|nr:hypothetical protein [Chloroflexota bacterium]